MFKKTLLTTMLAGASALLVACGATTHDAETVVSEANLAWNTAFNQGNAEELAGLYADDATVSPGNGEVLNSSEEITGLFESFFGMGLQNHTIEPVDIYSEGDQVVQLGEWSAEMIDEDGDTQQVGGILMTVLTPEGDDWQVQSHIWNMAE